MVVVLVALLIGACAPQSNSVAKNSPTSSPTLLRWSDCQGGFQCTTVQAPLDYAHPNDATIGIAISRKPATDTANRIGSLLINPGGPGASGIDWLRGEAGAMKNLNARFDLIGFDPRGVGKSDPVRCLDGPQNDAFQALDPVLDDPQEKQAGILADKTYVAGCMQRSSQILPFVDTVSAAKDMDVIRAALGDQKLTYLGFSYGTFLGQNYAHIFPTHVRGMALDGVVDPTLSADDLLYAQMVGFEQNLQAFLADCRARKSAASPCAYAQSGDPGAKLLALMRRLDDSPLQVGNRQLTRGLAMTGVLYTLYDQSFWPYLDRALTLADRNSGALLVLLADTYTGRNADGTYSNELEANAAVNCLDRSVPTDLAYYDALGAKYASTSALFGPAFQYSNLLCAYWPVKATGTVGPLSAPGAPSILVVGGTNDPATPYAWAQSVSQQLSGSVLLTRQGNGHTSYNSSPCSQQLIDAYLIDLSLPAAGTVCH
jgi:pimeloyl-ACP methyl ester carboxylesterase